MRVAMIGTGYVGLVSGACFADFGHQVICVDKDANKIAALKRGEMPIYEPGLEDLVASNVRAGRLSFSTDLKEPVKTAQAVFIAVGTPSRRGDGHADLTYVYDAAREIAAALAGYAVVVTKSTVPVGTGDEVERVMRQTRPDADFAVVSNPEFLREGAATGLPISPMSMNAPVKLPTISTATKLSSPSRPCRSAAATPSSASFARRHPTRRSPSSPTPNSCARAPRSRISAAPTESSSAPMTSAPGR